MKTKGLVIGKFYPLHNGHSYLITTAQKNSVTLDVLICDSPDYRIPATKRKDWIETLHPKVKVRIIPDIGKDDDSQAWADHTAQFLGYKPDIVFSSEDYGTAYAYYMNAEHVLVDKQRLHVPIAASTIRPDVMKHWHYLNPVVRQQYAKRICVLGAESTGTTTLTTALAQAYRTPWVPEYGRYYTEALMDPRHEWQSQEFTFIAQQQQALEDQLAGQSNGLLICDTNAFATRLWHERYMGYMSPTLDEIAMDDPIDLYVLTKPDIPFMQDGIRDGEHIRHDMHDRFKAELEKYNLPYIEVGGSVKNRMAVAMTAIEEVLQTRVAI